MQLNLSRKIFSAFMITILAAIVAMALIMYYSANWRFSEYVTKVEMESLDDLTAALGASYQEKQSWDQFRENPESWFRLIRLYLPEMPGHPHLRFPRGPGEEHRDYAGHGTPPERPHKPPPDKWPFNESAGAEAFRPPPGPPPPPPRREALGPRVALFDKDKQPVAGPSGLPVRNYALRPINVDQQTVGWLGLAPLKQGAHPLELAFIREQARAICFAGFFVFVLTGLISLFLSRHILSPVKKLTKAVEDLSFLKFGARIDVQTRDELGQLAEAFNSMAEALEKNETVRKQWTSDVAHELRTPLAILRGEIEAMQDGVREISAERLDSLHDETDRIGRLVDDLHALFVADSENLLQQKRPVKPLRILQEVVTSFGTRLTRAGMRLEARSIENDGSVIIGDEDGLRRLFANLIENSIRYTDSPGTLRINHYCSLQNVTFVFEDSAPGVPSEALDRIFDRLYRVDGSRSRAPGGSGLGLSICSEIVSGHGGAIHAAHSSLGGLLISFEFPLAKA